MWVHHRRPPRSWKQLTTAAAPSLRHLAGDDEIFQLKDTPPRGGCRQRLFWACRLWSSWPDRLTTARRDRLGRPPRSWGTLLLSGQRAPADPVTARKEARRGQRRDQTWMRWEVGMRVGGGGRSHEAAQSKYGISCSYRLDSFMPTQLPSRKTPLHNT